MKRQLAVFFVLITALTLVSTNAWAQATAQITGLVRDSSGAVPISIRTIAVSTEATAFPIAGRS